MKHISSRGPYLSSRKAANSVSLLSPYKSHKPLHLWNGTAVCILVFSFSLFFLFALFFFISLLISSLWRGQWWSILQLCCCCLFSAIVYSLSLDMSDQVRAGTAPVRRRGLPPLYAQEWHFSDTPLGCDWLYWAGSGEFLQIKLRSLGGATDSGFLHSWPVS